MTTTCDLGPASQLTEIVIFTCCRQKPVGPFRVDAKLRIIRRGYADSRARVCPCVLDPRSCRCKQINPIEYGNLRRKRGRIAAVAAAAAAVAYHILCCSFVCACVRAFATREHVKNITT